MICDPSLARDIKFHTHIKQTPCAIYFFHSNVVTLQWVVSEMESVKI
jgi:hypothetical protein